jgi:hypothetical protein
MVMSLRGSDLCFRAAKLNPFFLVLTPKKPIIFGLGAGLGLGFFWYLGFWVRVGGKTQKPNFFWVPVTVDY